MSYRIARINYDVYKTAGRLHGIESDAFRSKPYAEQKQFILDNCMVYGDGFRHNMSLQGNEAEEFLMYTMPLNDSWARERGLSTDPNDYVAAGSFDAKADYCHQITLKKLAEFKPDILFIQGINSFEAVSFAEFKELLPSVKYVVGHAGFTFGEKDVRGMTHVFGCLPLFESQAQGMGLSASTLYHAFDARVVDRIDNDFEEEYGLAFIGSSGHGYTDHKTRYWMLFDLLGLTDIGLWVDEQYAVDKNEQWENLYNLRKSALERMSPQDFHPRFRDKLYQLTQGVPHAPLSVLFPERCHQPVFQLDMYKLIRSAQVLLNIHTDIAQGEAGNMRLFEAGGVGCVQLVEHASNIHDIYEPDIEVATFKSTEEAIEKARYLREHPEVRVSMRKAAQARALKDHTVANRVEHIDEVVRSLL
jgi:spore maturation protein CgeB